MSIVKNRETIIIKQKLTATGIFKKYINIGFIPDELRIVQVIYAGTVAGDVLYSVVWNGVGELFILDNSHNIGNMNVRINVHGKNIQGMQTFQIMQLGDTADDPDVISMTPTPSALSWNSSNIEIF